MGIAEPTRKTIWQRFSRYGILSAASFVYIAAVLVLLTEWAGLDASVSYGIALATALVFNFVLMRFWVYADNQSQGAWHRQFLSTLAVSFSVRLLEWVVYTAMLAVVPIHYFVLMLLVNGTSFVLKFFIYNKFVFGREG